MAKFVLKEAERVLHRHRITTTVGRQVVPGELILTDQRVVLSQDAAGVAAAFAWFGLLGGLLSALKRPVMSHQIWRTEFSAAEVTGVDELKVRSQGEGYAVTWFEVRPVGLAAARTKAATEWADRLHRWAAGTLDAAELPLARRIDR
jgi:hypothetical protein